MTDPAERLRSQLRIYAITPDTDDAGALVAAVRRAAAGGVTAVQYRDKTGRPPAERRELAGRLAAACAEHDVFFVINDDADLALEVGADAVHLGPSDEDVAAVRARVGRRILLGASAGRPERALELVEAGADYLGVGAIFDAHGTKPDASAPRGAEVLRTFRATDGLERIPVVAIGGITASTARACVDAGADGVAMTRGLLGAADIEGAVRAAVAAVGPPKG